MPNEAGTASHCFTTVRVPVPTVWEFSSFDTVGAHASKREIIYTHSTTANVTIGSELNILTPIGHAQQANVPPLRIQISWLEGIVVQSVIHYKY
jgi:hypothetical protein